MALVFNQMKLFIEWIYLSVYIFPIWCLTHFAVQFTKYFGKKEVDFYQEQYVGILLYWFIVLLVVYLHL